MNNVVRRTPDAGADEVIHLRAEPGQAAREGTNWGAMLVLFMRTVSGLWILRGLLHWEQILGPDQTPFETLPTVIAASVVFFAVADLISAVGLWLASAWGGVLWLFSVTANIIVTVAVPDFHGGGRVMLVIDFALIVGYFVLTWYAAQQRED